MLVVLLEIPLMAKLECGTTQSPPGPLFSNDTLDNLPSPP